MNKGHLKNIIYAGRKSEDARKALVMVHGRGGSAEDILSLAGYLEAGDFALTAPQASGHSWYPYSFMAPPVENEPWLSSALSLLQETVKELQAAGIPSRNIYLLGFSQGACLTLEFAARNAERYGGIIAFTGGLIGDRIYLENYGGDFAQTPVFIGTSDPDPHVPVERVKETVNILKGMNAAVTANIYPDMGHNTISQDEIGEANRILAG